MSDSPKPRLNTPQRHPAPYTPHFGSSSRLFPQERAVGPAQHNLTPTTNALISRINSQIKTAHSSLATPHKADIGPLTSSVLDLPPQPRGSYPSPHRPLVPEPEPSDLESYRHRVANLQCTLRSLEKRNAFLESRVQTAQQVDTQLRQRVEEAERKHVEAEHALGRVSVLQAELDHLRQEASSHAAEMMEALAAQRKAEAVSSALSASEAAHELVRQDATDDLRHQVLALRKECEGLRARMQEAGEQRARADETASVLRVKLAQSERACGDLSTQIVQLADQKDGLYKKVQEFESNDLSSRQQQRIEELTSMVDAFSAERDALLSQLSEATRTITQFSKDLEDEQKRHGVTRSALAAQKAETEGVMGVSEDLEQRLSQSQQEQRETAKQVSEAEKLVERLQKHIDSHTSSSQEKLSAVEARWRAKCEAMEDRLASEQHKHQADAEGWADELRGLKNELSVAGVAHQEAEGRISHLTEILSSHQGSVIPTMEKELAETKHLLVEAEKELAGRGREEAELRRKLKHARSDSDAKAAKLDQVSSQLVEALEASSISSRKLGDAKTSLGAQVDALRKQVQALKHEKAECEGRILQLQAAVQQQSTSDQASVEKATVLGIEAQTLSQKVLSLSDELVQVKAELAATHDTAKLLAREKREMSHKLERTARHHVDYLRRLRTELGEGKR